MQRKTETLLEDNWLGIKKDDPHTKTLLLGTLSQNLLKSQTEVAELVSLRPEMKRLRQRE